MEKWTVAGNQTLQLADWFIATRFYKCHFIQEAI
jgi:hypothetical protein